MNSLLQDLHFDRGDDARAWHRRDDCDLHGCQRGAPAPAAVCRARSHHGFVARQAGSSNLSGVSESKFVFWREQSQSFEGVAATV